MGFHVILVFCLVVLCSSIRLRQHQYWFDSFKQTAKSGIPHADVAWNYCDLKCLYLETIIPNTDFFVIKFKDQGLKPNFSACYAQKSGGNIQLWSKVLTNSFYQRACGDDIQDYLSNEKYQKISEQGIGIGTQLKY